VEAATPARDDPAGAEVRRGHAVSKSDKAAARKRGTASEAWVLFFELFGRYRPRWLAIMGEHGLKPPMVHALQELDEPKPMGKLAVSLHCDNSNITWIVDRLEERGYVERRPDPGDRRVKLIALTLEGRSVRDQITERIAEAPEEIKSLSVADQRTLRDVLRRALDRESD
jgi:MarR family transcriptional regulator, organic hydroperoxide resistance regulator